MFGFESPRSYEWLKNLWGCGSLSAYDDYGVNNRCGSIIHLWMTTGVKQSCWGYESLPGYSVVSYIYINIIYNYIIM